MWPQIQPRGIWQSAMVLITLARGRNPALPTIFYRIIHVMYVMAVWECALPRDPVFVRHISSLETSLSANSLALSVEPHTNNFFSDYSRDPTWLMGVCGRVPFPMSMSLFCLRQYKYSWMTTVYGIQITQSTLVVFISCRWHMHSATFSELLCLHSDSDTEVIYYRAAWNADAVLRWEFRPSVRPSNAWIVTKRQKDMFRFLYDTKDNLS